MVGLAGNVVMARCLQTCRDAMPVWPVAAHVHQRIGFDGEDFGSSNVRFPGWKVPEFVGEVEDVLPPMSREDEGPGQP